MRITIFSTIAALVLSIFLSTGVQASGLLHWPDDYIFGVLAPVPGYDITRDPADVPPNPLPDGETVTITAQEVVAQIAPGINFRYFAFGGGMTDIQAPKVPGPFIRVKQGNEVTIELDNTEGAETHSIDLHAALGYRGGGALLMAGAGGTASFTFTAQRPGLYVYHCVGAGSPHAVAHHMNNGMYGLILVEPKGGKFKSYLEHGNLKEFYVFESEVYMDDEDPADYNTDDVAAEAPDLVVYNGRLGGLTSHPLMASVGDRAVIYHGHNGGTPASFHAIGTIFDRVWHEGGLMNDPLTDIQTTTIPCGGTTVVGMEMVGAYAFTESPLLGLVPGAEILVDHRQTALEKGAVGLLVVE